MDEILKLEWMTLDHLDRITEIEAAAFSNPWTRRDFEFALKRSNSICQIVLFTDQLIGYVVGFTVDREYHLADFAVAPDFQRQGLGRKTLEMVFDALGTQAQVVSLEVRMSNQVAIDLYKKMGFETVAIRKDYYTGPAEDALVMLKSLNTRLSDWVSAVLPKTAKNKK